MTDFEEQVRDALASQMPVALAEALDPGEAELYVGGWTDAVNTLAPKVVAALTTTANLKDREGFDDGISGFHQVHLDAILAAIRGDA